MIPQRDICILITGGTLDKVHDTLSEGLAFEDTQPTHMDDLMRQARTEISHCEILMKIDSLDMTDAHREVILNAVKNTQQNAVIITHGTGTMDLTAQYLSKHVTDKTVILTGAMRPFSLGRSDAPFNVGGAVIAAQTLPYGVYGVMNGRVFEAQNLCKNTKTGRFD
ncbi:MAG: asparaginase domain-containing protein [Maricaulaceae bacterium]